MRVVHRLKAAVSGSSICMKNRGRGHKLANEHSHKRILRDRSRSKQSEESNTVSIPSIILMIIRGRVQVRANGIDSESSRMRPLNHPR